MKTHKHSFFLVKIIKIFIITLTSVATLSILFLLITPYPSYSDCFRNLEEIEAYAKVTDELVPMDTDNTIRPEFNKYYNQFTQTYSKTAQEKFAWLFSKLGLKKQPIWSITAFKNLLERVTKQQEAKGFKGDVIAKIEGTESSKFIVFGNIQGAFHSFTRCLGKLKELGIIDTNLKIIQPNHYIVFNGDLIDRSPFTIETLTIALKLIEKNPEHVIYIRGNHEEGNYWQEQTLKAELLVRATPVSNDPIPLEKEVNQFFTTLPLTVYISIPSNPTTDFVRIGEPGLGEDPRLDEARYANFLQTKASGHLTPYVIKSEGEQSEGNIIIKAIIKSEKKRQEFQIMEGLRLLAPDKGATAWNVLSCPTVVYGTVLKFFHDAFTIVATAKAIDDWMITLYARDRREKQPFIPKTFNFVTGTEAGKQDDTKKEAPAKPAVQLPAEKQQDIIQKQEQHAQPVQKSQQPTHVPQKITITPAETLSGQEIPIMIVTPPNVVIQQVTVPIKDTEQSAQKAPITKQKAQPAKKEDPEEVEEDDEEEQEAPQKTRSHETQHTVYTKDHDKNYQEAATHHIIQSTITSVPETTYQEQPGMYYDQSSIPADQGQIDTSMPSADTGG